MQLIIILILLSITLSGQKYISSTDGTAGPIKSLSSSEPTVSSCGSGASIDGNDGIGTISTGSGIVTSCNLDFSQKYSSAPVCVLTPSGAVTLSSTTDSEGIDIFLSLSLPSGKIYYICGIP